MSKTFANPEVPECYRSTPFNMAASPEAMAVETGRHNGVLAGSPMPFPTTTIAQRSAWTSIPSPSSWRNGQLAYSWFRRFLSDFVRASGRA